MARYFNYSDGDDPYIADAGEETYGGIPDLSNDDEDLSDVDDVLNLAGAHGFPFK
jgi:hypothetical protein